MSETLRGEVSERPICGQPHTKVSETLSVGIVSGIYYHRTSEGFGRGIKPVIWQARRVTLYSTYIVMNDFSRISYSQLFFCKVTTSPPPLSIPFALFNTPFTLFHIHSHFRTIHFSPSDYYIPLISTTLS